MSSSRTPTAVFVLTIAMLLFTAAPVLPAQSGPSAVSIPAQSFVQSLGVNTHLEYTDGRYADPARVLEDLRYLGVSLVRDGIPQSIEHQGLGIGLKSWDKLASAGITFDVPIPANADLDLQLQQIRIELKRHPGMVAAVEGPNEINNAPVHYAGQSGDEAARGLQRAIYTAVHSEPALHNVPVYYFTGGRQVDLLKTPGLADYENVHPYPHLGEQPAAWIEKEFKDYFENPNESPRVISETGYYTDPASRDWGGVDPATQAKLILNTWFDAIQQGVSRVFLYQLLDPYAPTQPQGAGADSRLGLFSLDNKPKPSADAIRRVIQLLSDGPSRPRTIHMAIRGMPATGHALFLTKSTGRTVAAFWNETPAWDSKTMQPVNSPPVAVRVWIEGAAGAEIVDPLNEGSKPLHKTPDGVFTVFVPDHVVLLMLH